MSLQQVLQQGWQLHQARRLDQAEALYRQVLTVAPQMPEAWCYLGIVLYDQGRFAESVEAYRRAVELRPQFPVAWSNMGNSLSAMQRYEEAESSIRRALAQDAQYATAWLNLGAVLLKQGRLSEAVEALERAAALAPASEAVHRNLAAALVRTGRIEEGLQHNEEAVRLAPRSAEARRNRAILRLLMGEWQQGWQEYEWRWLCPEQKLPARPEPLYNGEPLEGKQLLLIAEQGLGDTIQFIRYAELAQQRGARVAAEVQPELVPLLSDYKAIQWLLPRGGPTLTCDYFLPLLSAPRVFGTRVDQVPNRVPYLHARPERIEKWRRRLPPAALRVGLVWQGSRAHPSDRDRSMPLELLARLARPGRLLVSLQKGPGVEQLAHLGQPETVLDLSQELDRDAPFLDTAALLTLLDVTVCVDTSVAHLAGALAVPVWVALPYIPDWRWLLHRSDTPWYPTMRLFRQPKPGDWQSVVAQLDEALSREEYRTRQGGE
jgi:tetratricopeptide (TPR) repeat protein